MKPKTLKLMFFLLALPIGSSLISAKESYSGIYPHLGYYNNEGECGTGAVVPWADRLWVITYAPHRPLGSSDKLYEITPELDLIVRSESVGGTPANRMIHKESGQLNIGPYFIDEERNVRVINPSKMPGRLTGTARHLTDPENKLYIATMEEGLYTVDVNSLEVVEHIKDGNRQDPVGGGVKSNLPGYHGKGLYSGQGYLIYSNNGEKKGGARSNPFVPSGALATWQGEGDWDLVLRNQFVEVTGPGGIYGNADPKNDPVWSTGWDAKSVLLMCLHKGEWHRYRLPKASHAYDGAHGWNTEWPRIREIGTGDDLLMTMHGMFWTFPKTFTPENSRGIKPLSSYLKVIGDFAKWQGKVVFGTDDTARKEFLNKRKVKGHIAEPQSNSNLWFVDPEELDNFGPVIGRGAVWLKDDVAANTPSAPFLIDNYSYRAIHLNSTVPTTITIEVDKQGNGEWSHHDTVEVNGYQWYEVSKNLDATWLRLSSSKNLRKATAWFHMDNGDSRKVKQAPDIFDGVARVGETSVNGGIVHAAAKNKRNFQFAADTPEGRLGFYLLDGNMQLTSSDIQQGDWLRENAAIPDPTGIIEIDDASVIYTEDNGKRYRIPYNPAYKAKDKALGYGRVSREVVTERDLFNFAGTFYELPANNAAGFARVRPVSSHNLAIKDYASFRGLIVMSGVNLDKAGDNKHIIRSDDGKAGLWVGGIDDMWKLGKPVGVGGPWMKSPVKANTPSDPYLMTSYDKKELTLESSNAATITVEVDISGVGDWYPYKSFELQAGKKTNYVFPKAFEAYWVRVTSDTDTTATAQLVYK